MFSYLFFLKYYLNSKYFQFFKYKPTRIASLDYLFMIYITISIKIYIQNLFIMEPQTSNLYTHDCPLKDDNFRAHGPSYSFHLCYACCINDWRSASLVPHALRDFTFHILFTSLHVILVLVLFLQHHTIHLLFEAHENLSSPCLSNAFRQYPYAYGIALFSIFVTFLIELVTKFKIAEEGR